MQRRNIQRFLVDTNLFISAIKKWAKSTDSSGAPSGMRLGNTEGGAGGMGAVSSGLMDNDLRSKIAMGGSKYNGY